MTCEILLGGKGHCIVCNGIGTHNHLVHKLTINHLAKLTSLTKWLNVRLRTKWQWIRIPLQSLKLQI